MSMYDPPEEFGAPLTDADDPGWDFQESGDFEIPVRSHGAVATAPPLPNYETIAAATAVTAEPVEMKAARNPADSYAFFAFLCALVGFIIPILPAAAALMLVRATEPPYNEEPLGSSAASLANTARTLAYISLALLAAISAALLLGILGRVISS